MPNHSLHLSVRRAGVLVTLGAAMLGGLCAPQAAAQRPFSEQDPFYRGETARRVFFDGYALTTEVSYHSPGAAQGDRESLTPDFLGLSFRLDYQFGPHIDLGAILDAAGSINGRTLALNWLTFKYYESEETEDYAFRLAIDPSFDGRLGAPQIDVAFLNTSLLGPNLSFDYAFGIRRVRMGYEQWVSEKAGPAGTEASPIRPEIIYTRALGWEFHFMSQWSYLLNPARSNIYGSLLLDVGNYKLFEATLSRPDAPVAPGATPEVAFMARPQALRIAGEDATLDREYYGFGLTARAGIDFSRPSFQVMPFVSYRLVHWLSDGAEAPLPLGGGLRFMLR